MGPGVASELCLEIEIHRLRCLASQADHPCLFVFIRGYFLFRLPICVYLRSSAANFFFNLIHPQGNLLNAVIQPVIHHAGVVFGGVGHFFPGHAEAAL